MFNKTESSSSVSAKSVFLSVILAMGLFATACGSTSIEVDTAASQDAAQPTRAPEPADEPAPEPTSAPEPADEPAPEPTRAPEPAAAPAPEPTSAPEPADEPAEPAPDSERDDFPEGPIPVEPDGGIGDGAEPLPGADPVQDTGTWHGEEVAITNCPGQSWTRVQASAFSFSVPTDFIEQDVQPFDSEIGYWNGGDDIEVSFDYGWYSGQLSQEFPGAEVEPVDYSGIVGERTIIRRADTSFVGVFFGEVDQDFDEWNRLGLTVRFSDPNDEVIGRCVVGSIEWTDA